MFGTSAGGNSAYKVLTSFGHRLLMTAAAVIALPPVAFAQSSGADGTDAQSFFVLNNPGDPNFNQLLGINDRQVIVGYFGNGTVIANNGYVLVPRSHYSAGDFAGVWRQRAPLTDVTNGMVITIEAISSGSFPMVPT